MVTESQLREVMTRRPALVTQFYPLLVAGMSQYHIDTWLRQAAFIATIAHESAELRYTQEVWGPTDAQERYEGRKDLGNTQKGDGSRYRGRGLIMITGRGNYQEASDALRVDYVADPERLAQPPDASNSACWWWAKHGCNELADAEDFEGVTKKVNGGLNGWDSREYYYRRALQVFGEP